VYEHHKHRLLTRSAFLRRAGWHVVLALLIVVWAVGCGTVGYHLAGLDWIDAFLNASMILSGEGPVDRMETTGAKLFAALYALFSGLAFVAVMGVMLAPWLHRLFHWIHLEEPRA